MSEVFQIESSCLSHPGKKRANNEDFVTFFEPVNADDLFASGRLYIVADGVGGAADGERASKYAAEKVKYDYYQSPELEPGERLRHIMRQVSYEIFEHAETSGGSRRMATTMVAAVILQDLLIVANVGDSRAYLIRGGQAQQITHDHNSVSEMVRNGLMTPEEAAVSNAKNRLTRSLGGDEDVRVDVFPFQLQPGDKILLCTDGLTRYVLEQDIVAMTAKGSLEACVTQMIDFANGQGGIDNISVLLIAVNLPGAAPMRSAARGERPAPVGIDDITETQPVRSPLRPRPKPASLSWLPDEIFNLLNIFKSSPQMRRWAPLVTAGLVVLCVGMIAGAWIISATGSTVTQVVIIPTIVSTPTGVWAIPTLPATISIEPTPTQIQVTEIPAPIPPTTSIPIPTLEPTVPLPIGQELVPGQYCVKKIQLGDSVSKLLGVMPTNGTTYHMFSECSLDQNNRMICQGPLETVTAPEYKIDIGKWFVFPVLSADECKNFQGVVAIANGQNR